MKHDNDTIVRDICIATGAVAAACIASLATTAKYLFHFCIDTQWKRSVFHQSLIAPERIENFSRVRHRKQENGSRKPNSL